MNKEVKEWIIAIAIAVVSIVIIINFVGKSYTVRGDSMYPTLKDGERVIVNIAGVKFGSIHKGNVIVFHHDKKDDYVKRVIGTPGDHIQYKKDQLYVNGKKVKEPYLDYNEKHKQIDYITDKSWDSKEINNGEAKIPKDKLLVLGDNREISKDSRSFGLIDRDQVVGKVSLRYWPFKEWKYNFNPST
ncbi:signal peptidase I [Staphylococcus sp. SQ8-PEA]|uniref:Signal peptidase I n=1 Tax=Staphylococcus marylandisciuri TaxID=2981529 RepID=A0ABT2QPR2_9STAP|nr:signal peptidase I [Staphylococcus marylandisciuri]MCU5745968.1 signal peptidase I [Staphylococcus marylandisciuri]